MSRADLKCSLSLKPAWSAPTAIRIASILANARVCRPRAAHAKLTTVQDAPVSLAPRVRLARAMSQATIAIGPRGEDRIRRGHPWIYRGDVLEVNAEPGDTVTVVGPRRRRLGQALYSDRSQIALRMLTHLDADAGPDLWRRRIETAMRFRDSLHIDATAMRLVHGEADLLPSLIVDRY